MDVALARGAGMTKYQKLFYRMGQAAGIVFVGAWFWWGAAEMNYVSWPRAPQPEIGRTIPYQTKGVTVYIAKSDQDFGMRLTYVMIGSGIVFLIGAVFSGELQRIMNPVRKPPQSN
jgi:hypothetical protein